MAPIEILKSLLLDSSLLENAPGGAAEAEADATFTEVSVIVTTVDVSDSSGAAFVMTVVKIRVLGATEGTVLDPTTAVLGSVASGGSAVDKDGRSEFTTAYCVYSMALVVAQNIINWSLS